MDGDTGGTVESLADHMWEFHYIPLRELGDFPSREAMRAAHDADHAAGTADEVHDHNEVCQP